MKTRDENYNPAIDTFIREGKDSREFSVWYDVDSIKYLLHSSDNSDYWLKYVFWDDQCIGGVEEFNYQLTALIKLAHSLNRPTLFISKEPGHLYHWIAGIIQAGNLFLFNPVGLTKHQMFYEALAHVQQQAHSILKKVVVSNTTIQRDTNGLVSCGPLCVEWGMQICRKKQIPDNILKSFEKNPDKSGKGLNYTELDIGPDLSGNLCELKSPMPPETYEKKLVQIRKEHYSKLPSIGQEINNNFDIKKHFEAICNPPQQKLLLLDRYKNDDVNQDFKVDFNHELYKKVQQQLGIKNMLSVKETVKDNNTNSRNIKPQVSRNNGISTSLVPQNSKANSKPRQNKIKDERYSIKSSSLNKIDSDLTMDIEDNSTSNPINGLSEKSPISTKKRNRASEGNNKDECHKRSKQDIHKKHSTASSEADSDIEEELTGLNLPENYLEESPYKFYLNKNKRGKIGSIKKTPDNIISCPELNTIDARDINYVVNIPVIASEEKKSVSLHSMLQNQSFGKTSSDSKQQTQYRVSLTIGVNKPKSIIQDKNKILYEELNTPITSCFPLKRIGFFWKPQWELINPQSYTLRFNTTDNRKKFKKSTKSCELPILVKLVDKKNVPKKFYIYGKWLNSKPKLREIEKNHVENIFNDGASGKITVSNNSNKKLFNAILEVKGHSGKTTPVGLGTVRKWNSNAHKSDHISKEESQKQRKMKPYRELRDTIKDSEESLALLNNAHQRTSKNKMPTYLMFFDSSVESFRTRAGRGVLSCYDQFLHEYYKKKNKYPEVISTGYRIDYERYLHDAKAIDYDMFVRTLTNKNNEGTIYPPEPNLGIKTIPFKKPENFSDGGKSYSSPLEAIIIMQNIKSERNIPEGDFGCIFEGEHAVQITARDRMLQKSSKGGRKEYQPCKLNFRGDFYSWNKQTFTNFRNTSQSHYDLKQWVDSILKNYKLEGVTIYENENGLFSEEPSNTIKTHLLNKKQVENALVSLLSKLFAAYDPVSICNKFWNENKRGDSEFRKLLEGILGGYEKLVPFIMNQKKARKLEIYNKYFDKTETMDDIKKYVSVLSSSVGNNFDAIEDSAQLIGKKICDDIGVFFLSDHHVQTEQLLISFSEEFNGFQPNTALSDTTKIMIDAVCKDEFSSIGKGYLDMGYLHLAALTGNRNFVAYLLDNNLSPKNIKAKFGILPLHCAIKYHIKHVENYDWKEFYPNDFILIQLLADANNLFYQMDDGRTALYIILTELEKPLKLIIKLYESGCINARDYCLCFLYINMLKEKGINFSEFNNPIINIIEHMDNEIYAAELIKFFVKIGADVDKNNRKGDRFSYRNNESLFAEPLFFAIDRKSAPIIEAIYEMGGNFRGIEDEIGFPPLLRALYIKAPPSVIKTLYLCGADLLEENSIDRDQGIYFPDDSHLHTCAIIEIIQPTIGHKRDLDLLRLIIANETAGFIRKALVRTSFDADFTDSERCLLGLLLKKGDKEALQIIFCNDDKNKSRSIWDSLSSDYQKKIAKFCTIAKKSSLGGFSGSFWSNSSSSDSSEYSSSDSSSEDNDSNNNFSSS